MCQIVNKDYHESRIQAVVDSAKTRPFKGAIRFYKSFGASLVDGKHVLAGYNMHNCIYHPGWNLPTLDGKAVGITGRLMPRRRKRYFETRVEVTLNDQFDPTEIHAGVFHAKHNPGGYSIPVYATAADILHVGWHDVTLRAMYIHPKDYAKRCGK